LLSIYIFKLHNIIKYVKVTRGALVYNVDIITDLEEQSFFEFKTKTRDVLSRNQNYKCTFCGL